VNPMDGLFSAPASLGAMGLVIWWAVALLVTALIAAWIARDAVARGVPAPWAFTVAAAFQPVFVLVVYVFAREALVRAETRTAPRPN